MSAQGFNPQELMALFGQGPQQPAPGQGQAPPESPEQIAERILSQIMGGEAPGQGYLYPDDPAKRQSTLVKTDADAVRASLLRGVEAMAMSSLLPLGAVGKGEVAKAALAMAQAYLLLDPTVDSEGVPVQAKHENAVEQAAIAAGAQGIAQGHAQAHVAHETADAQARTAAHASGAQFKRAVTQSGYQEPPRVQPNPAELAIAEKHKSQAQELRGARGDRPLPKPRVGQ